MFKIYSIRFLATALDTGAVQHPTVSHDLGKRKYHFKKPEFYDKNLVNSKRAVVAF
jgi:hypothetical protein